MQTYDVHRIDNRFRPLPVTFAGIKLEFARFDFLEVGKENCFVVFGVAKNLADEDARYAQSKQRVRHLMAAPLQNRRRLRC